MGDLSKHFNRSEFACKDGCGFDTVDAELVTVLEDAYGYFAEVYDTRVRIIITSGCRCVEHNRAIGGAEGSYHPKAKAADFKVQYHVPYQGWVDVPADSVAGYLENKYPDRYGIGRYIGRTHADVRAERARWDCR